MARRHTPHFNNTIEQEIIYRIIPHTGGRAGLMKIAKFVDGTEEPDSWPDIGTAEKLTGGRFGMKFTFSVFVSGGFDKNCSRSFDIRIIGEDGVEFFTPNNNDRFYIQDTEIFYDGVCGWQTIDINHYEAAGWGDFD